MDLSDACCAVESCSFLPSAVLCYQEAGRLGHKETLCTGWLLLYTQPGKQRVKTAGHCHLHIHMENQWCFYQENIYVCSERMLKQALISS